MRLFLRGILLAWLILGAAHLGWASCASDDPDGSKVAAARATADQTCSGLGAGCDAGNHGAYVSCVAHVASDLVNANMLPKSCKGAVKKCAAHSTCGKPGAVTCCLTTAKGTKCKIKKDAASCSAKSGTAGSCASCCDACPPPGSGPSCPASATTTTTPGATTTTTTTPPPTSLKFTTVAGTTGCGSNGFSNPALAPFSGEIDSDTGGTTKLDDLGLGCLYLGGGNTTVYAGATVPAVATSYFGIGSGGSLIASSGTGRADCTRGAGPGKHCVNNDALPACTSDADCGGYSDACVRDANCFLGPPLELPTPVLSSQSTCLINVVETDASGTLDPTPGDATLTVPVSSRIYITGNLGSPCPHCASGSCTYGARASLGCATTSSSGTSIDCPPEMGGGAYQDLMVANLTPLTTGTSTLTDAAGNFCASQRTAGAFSVAAARRISEHGTAAGDLTGGAAKPVSLASAFCIPATASETDNYFIDLPGPGGLGLDGTAQIVPTP